MLPSFQKLVIDHNVWNVSKTCIDLLVMDSSGFFEKKGKWVAALLSGAWGSHGISNFLRDVSSSSPKRFREQRFTRSEMKRSVREGSPCRTNFKLDMSMLHFIMESEVKLEGRPCIGNINSGQSCNSNVLKSLRPSLSCNK